MILGKMKETAEAFLGKTIRDAWSLSQVKIGKLLIVHPAILIIFCHLCL
jgi:hypothetical protein